MSAPPATIITDQQQQQQQEQLLLPAATVARLSTRHLCWAKNNKNNTDDWWPALTFASLFEAIKVLDSCLATDQQLHWCSFLIQEMLGATPPRPVLLVLQSPLMLVMAHHAMPVQPQFITHYLDCAAELKTLSDKTRASYRMALQVALAIVEQHRDKETESSSAIAESVSPPCAIPAPAPATAHEDNNDATVLPLPPPAPAPPSVPHHATREKEITPAPNQNDDAMPLDDGTDSVENIDDDARSTLSCYNVPHPHPHILSHDRRTSPARPQKLDTILQSQTTTTPSNQRTQPQDPARPVLSTAAKKKREKAGARLITRRIRRTQAAATTTNTMRPPAPSVSRARPTTCRRVQRHVNSTKTNENGVQPQANSTAGSVTSVLSKLNIQMTRNTFVVPVVLNIPDEHALYADAYSKSSDETDDDDAGPTFHDSVDQNAGTITLKSMRALQLFLCRHGVHDPENVLTVAERQQLSRWARRGLVPVTRHEHQMLSLPLLQTETDFRKLLPQHGLEVSLGNIWLPNANRELARKHGRVHQIHYFKLEEARTAFTTWARQHWQVLLGPPFVQHKVELQLRILRWLSACDAPLPVMATAPRNGDEAMAMLDETVRYLQEDWTLMEDDDEDEEEESAAEEDDASVPVVVEHKRKPKKDKKAKKSASKKKPLVPDFDEQVQPLLKKAGIKLTGSDTFAVPVNDANDTVRLPSQRAVQLYLCRYGLLNAALLHNKELDVLRRWAGYGYLPNVSDDVIANMPRLDEEKNLPQLLRTYGYEICLGKVFLPCANKGRESRRHGQHYYHQHELRTNVRCYCRAHFEDFVEHPDTVPTQQHVQLLIWIAQCPDALPICTRERPAQESMDLLQQLNDNDIVCSSSSEDEKEEESSLSDSSVDGGASPTVSDTDDTGSAKTPVETKKRTKSKSSPLHYWKHEELPTFTDVWPLLESIGFAKSNQGFSLPPGSYVDCPPFANRLDLQEFLCQVGVPQINALDAASRDTVERWMRFSYVPLSRQRSTMAQLQNVASFPNDDKFTALLAKYDIRVLMSVDRIYLPGEHHKARLLRRHGEHYFQLNELYTKFLAWARSRQLAKPKNVSDADHLRFKLRCAVSSYSLPTFDDDAARKWLDRKFPPPPEEDEETQAEQKGKNAKPATDNVDDPDTTSPAKLAIARRTSGKKRASMVESVDTRPVKKRAAARDDDAGGAKANKETELLHATPAVSSTEITTVDCAMQQEEGCHAGIGAAQPLLTQAPSTDDLDNEDDMVHQSFSFDTADACASKNYEECIKGPENASPAANACAVAQETQQYRLTSVDDAGIEDAPVDPENIDRERDPGSQALSGENSQASNEEDPREVVDQPLLTQAASADDESDEEADITRSNVTCNQPAAKLSVNRVSLDEKPSWTQRLIGGLRGTAPTKRKTFETSGSTCSLQRLGQDSSMAWAEPGEIVDEHQQSSAVKRQRTSASTPDYLQRLQECRPANNSSPTLSILDEDLSNISAIMFTQ